MTRRKKHIPENVETRDGRKDAGREDSPLLNAATVARMLNVSQSHLCGMRNLPDGGGLPVVYVGGKRTPRYPLEGVREFIARGGTQVPRDGGAMFA